MKSSIKALNKICDEKSRKRLKFEDGTMSVDGFTASAILCVYNTVERDETKEKIVRYLTGTKNQFISLSKWCFKCLNGVKELRNGN